MSVLALLLIGLLATQSFLLLLWFVSKKGTHAAWADVGWSASVGFLSLFYALTSDGNPTRRCVFALLVGIWSIRLTTHLFINRVRDNKRDSRYEELRAEWGKSSSWRFGLFFQIQGLLAYVLTIQFIFMATDTASVSAPALLTAISLFLIAVVGESVADRQLAQFKRSSKGASGVCTVGLWRYSRHPNYFFEWLHWLSYIALSVGTAFWWVSALTAVGMLLLILFVTGIPYTEAVSVKRRGEEYKKYQQSTSAFVPWIPAKEVL